MVNLVGMNGLELPGAEERHVRTIVERHMTRVRTLTDDVIDARVRFKRFTKYGSTPRYEISIALLTSRAGPRYATSSNWNLATAVHNAFESIEHQLAAQRDIDHRTGHHDVWKHSNPVI
jgi:ribosome-associated translation inhibitor RaiA